MSKYTSEQVLDAADALPAAYDDQAEMLLAFAPLLRERESAKDAVTDEMCEAYKQAHELSRIQYTKEHPGYGMQAAIDAGIRGGLEAVAPMLASARVPNEMLVGLAKNSADGYYREGWNECRNAMLAAAPKPETEE